MLMVILMLWMLKLVIKLAKLLATNALKIIKKVIINCKVVYQID